MDKVLSKRQAIYDHYHSSARCQAGFTLYSDRFAAYYTSMYLIMDTGEAICVHVREGFSKDPYRAYIEFWGIMQAIIIQQDAIVELHNAVCGTPWKKLNADSAWMKLREKRNILAGHPARKSIPKSALVQRSFMGRAFGTYDQIRYETWSAATERISLPTFDLRELLSCYDLKASQRLTKILRIMRKGALAS